MADAIKNFAKVTVSTGYNAAATSIVLTSGGGAKLPAVPFNLVWWNVTDYPDPSDDPNVEIVRVTAISTDTLTVTRAQESTSASTKNTAGKTYQMIQAPTAKTITDLVPASNVGTGANNVVALDGSARLPAVDGSQLTNLPTKTLNSFFNSGGNHSNTADSNVAELMAGCNWTFTPSKTGKVMVFVAFQAQNTGGRICDYSLYTGTGTPPTSGASVSGTQRNNASYVVNGGSMTPGGNLLAIVSGLTVGTTYWFDIAFGARGNSTDTTWLWNPFAIIVELGG
jgi:hypothetical protein